MAKLSAPDFSSMNLNDIDIEISKLETMLQGNIDANNLKKGINIPTNCISDTDNYIESMIMLGTYPTDFMTAILALETKIDSVYDNTTVTGKASWTLTNETFDSSDTKTTEKSSYIAGSENNTLVTDTRNYNIDLAIDKATDYKCATFEEFFSIVHSSLYIKGGITETLEEFLVSSEQKFNVDMDSQAMTSTVISQHSLTGDANGTDEGMSTQRFHIAIGEIQDDVDTVIMNTALVMLSDGSISDKYFLNINADFTFLMKRIV